MNYTFKYLANSTTLAQTVTSEQAVTTFTVPTVAGLIATVPLYEGQVTYLAHPQRKGMFKWTYVNQATGVSSDTLQGIYIPPATDLTGKSGAWVRADLSKPCPEWWGGGAGGDDSDMFCALGDYITNLGGGYLEFAGNYNVGRQNLVNDGTYMFKPVRLTEIIGCSKPIIINGRGATITFNSGLKFGTFDSNGNATNHTMPYTGYGQISTPCLQGIICVQNATAPVLFTGTCDINGNIGAMTIGGQWGDTGWQLGGDGLFVMDNLTVAFEGAWSVHHCPRDGMQLRTVSVNNATPRSGSVYKGLYLHHNCRNNLSFGSGVGHTFIGCRFVSGGGRGCPISSAPAACFDLEAEAGPIRHIVFDDCEFSDGAVHGLIADSGDTAGITSRNCRFIGTVGYAAWSRKPRMRYFDCMFVGMLPTLYTDSTDSRNCTQFTRGRFTDDPSYTTGNSVAGNYLVDGGGGNAGVLFDDCLMTALNRAAVYFDGGSGNGVIWRNSTITQANNTPQGTFSVNIEGIRNSFTGPMPNVPGIYYGEGRIMFNGADPLFYSQAVPSTTVAAGLETTITISAVGRPLDYGWLITATYNKNLLGLVMSCFVADPGTIAIILSNPTGNSVTLQAGGTLSVRAKPMT